MGNGYFYVEILQVQGQFELRTDVLMFKVYMRKAPPHIPGYGLLNRAPVRLESVKKLCPTAHSHWPARVLHFLFHWSGTPFLGK